MEKEENFGYLLKTARGVWGIQNCKWNRMSRLFQTSSNRTQLFKFSWSWQRGLGDKKDSAVLYDLRGRILTIKSRNVFAQVIGVGGFYELVQRLSI